MAKEDILKALSEFMAPSLCRHNSYCDDIPLDSQPINGSDKSFATFGDQLPFTGRGSELGLLEDRIQENINIWSGWRNERFNPNLARANQSKRRYEHPAVATGPGRGKTA